MTCDDVFEAITSNHPHHLVEVAAHLGACPRCRDLAEAIEPLRHAWSDDDCPLDLPGPLKGPSEGLKTAQNAAARLNNIAASPPLAIPGRDRFLQFVAAFLAGAVAAAIFVMAYHSLPAFSAPSDARTVCLRQATESSGLPAEQLVVTCVACHLAAR
jgi:hypothetical protein